MSAHATKQAQPRDLPGPITRAARTISATFYLIATGLLALIGMTLPEDNRGRHAAAKTPGRSDVAPVRPPAGPPGGSGETPGLASAGSPPWDYLPAPVDDEWDGEHDTAEMRAAWFHGLAEPEPPLDPLPPHIAKHAAPDVPAAFVHFHSTLTDEQLEAFKAEFYKSLSRPPMILTDGPVITPPDPSDCARCWHFHPDGALCECGCDQSYDEPEPPTVTDMPAVADAAFVADTLASDPNAGLRAFVAQAGEFMADFPPSEPWILEEA